MASAGLTDADGETHEKVYSVVWSDDRTQDANGKVAPVGNTVNAEKATCSNTIGASELSTVRTDPDFEAAKSAFYDARVFETPTLKWFVYNVLKCGVDFSGGVDPVAQKRAYSSPIWHTPSQG